ncbi:efflux RND transporter permease subunit [Photobacterium sanguinicancri]|uniref:efflux RND transporter permease subunit n=1 Tax=Photobacterium sanguinicancri TaxID=875932 RepID=UPI0026E1350A|nr:efflux RND transporter permease subunit [Photobacterium sanguinicancri]MDO6498532.1 efflux RND transporter permease subunit [Photobacterium sanguinicancri]
MNIAEYSIKNRVLCAIVIMLTLVTGYSALQNMPRLEDPEFTIRQAQIITYYPGASPLEVAEEVSEPLESALQQMAEVKEVNSVSSQGKSEITVDIRFENSKTKKDLQLLWGKLRNKVSDARGNLPEGTLEPIVADDFGDLFGFYYFVYGKDYTVSELNDYAKTLRDEILQVKGVARVDIGAMPREAIFVEISKDKMKSLGVSVFNIYQAFQDQNLVVDSGNIAVDGRRMTITPKMPVNSIDSIANTLIRSSEDGNLVYLGDVATITKGFQKPLEKMYYYNGERALAFGVSATSGVNVVELGKNITQRINDTENLRPHGIEIGNYYHQGDSVETSVNDFVTNVIAALVIVIVTLLIFMGLKSAVIIGAILILTISATLAVMNYIDIPMHRISLGALIIALGMMVDNAIVVAEGILIGVGKGQNKLEVAKRIVTQTKWPLLGGTLVGIVAFAPIGLAPGDTAEYTGHLFWVILISLMFSWIFAITLTPVFCHAMFKNPKNGSNEEKEGKLTSGYKSMMRMALRHRVKVALSVLLVFFAAVYGFSKVKEGFFPASTSPQFVVDFWLPEGTDIDITNGKMIQLSEYVSGIDGVNTVQTSVGSGGLRYMLVYAPQSPNSSYGQLLIKTDNYQMIGDLIPMVQKHIDENYPTAKSKVWRFQLGPGGGSKIGVEFSGPDPKVLRQLVNQAKQAMYDDGGAIAIQDDWREEVSVIEPIFSPVKAKAAGVSYADVARAIRNHVSGDTVGVYREGKDLLPIISISPKHERESIEDMHSILVLSSATGNAVTLGEVVDGFRTIWREGKMMKKDRIWTMTAQSDPLPDELSSALRSRLIPTIEAIEIPDGYKMDWGGEYRDSTESNENLAKTLPFGLTTMVIIVFLLFGTVRQPVVIWLTVPLAIIGVVVGLLLTDMPLEFMGILGLLSLSGLLIKNSIVLVDQIDLEISEGKPRFDAIVDAAASRIRPVSMGALTTVLGIIPLYFDAFFKSMSVVLGFGLTFATILTLVIVPVLYAIFFRVNETEQTYHSGAAL